MDVLYATQKKIEMSCTKKSKFSNKRNELQNRCLHNKKNPSFKAMYKLRVYFLTKYYSNIT